MTHLTNEQIADLTELTAEALHIYRTASPHIRDRRQTQLLGAFGKLLPAALAELAEARAKPQISLTPIKIIEQGAPVVNDAVVMCRTPTVCTIVIDLASKRCVTDGCGRDDEQGPIIEMEANEHSLKLHETATGSTFVQLTEFAGWSLWSANISKHSACICLIKEQPHAD